ncbi:MAG: hypothetical protein D9V47_04240 [Clostridia bacterium]|nr:MAG: hypothetical protein D9V47_04240 [Clostridia bacterium]
MSRSWAIYGAGLVAVLATAAALALIFAGLAASGFFAAKAAGGWGLAGWWISLFCGALAANVTAQRRTGYAGERVAFGLWAVFAAVSVVWTGEFRWPVILLRLGLAWVASLLAHRVWQRLATGRGGLNQYRRVSPNSRRLGKKSMA